MAKLRDLKSWLGTTLGDVPRGNSLEKAGREARLFTVTSKGRDALDMVYTDFAVIIGMALTTINPIKAPGKVIDAIGLGLESITIESEAWGKPAKSYHAQMWKAKHCFANAWSDQSAEIVPQIAFAFPNEVPLNFIGAVSSLFAYDRKPLMRFHPQDRIELTESGPRLSIRLELHQGDDLPRATVFTFGNEADSDFRQVRTTRTLYAESLNALASMIRREGE
jgi:hypothetical protein